MDEVKQVLSYSIQKLLRPLVRIMLRNGISFGMLSNIIKWVYVDVAIKEFDITNKKQTDSRIAVITGLSRKEVKNVKQMTEPNDVTERYNRASRVISGWVRDLTFQDGWNEPAILPIEGKGATFTQLVKKYSGDIPTRAILDELFRVKAIKKLEDGRICLIERAYIPTDGEIDKLNILGTDVALLIDTIDHNLICKPEKAFFQRKVAYDNLPAEAIPELHKLTEKHAQIFLESLDQWLATQDRDLNPKINGNGRKHAGVGIYFFEENVEKQNED
ncbi:MAG TPA: hypothetical protein ENK59_08945 [Thioploca sp.]|nr:hypothetical protein [Thioploca sp.]